MSAGNFYYADAGVICEDVAGTAGSTEAPRVVAEVLSSSTNIVTPDSLPKIPGYSHIVTSSGGTTVYMSGQVALDGNATLIGPGNVELQADQVFLNLRRALAAVGATPANLVKITTFVTDVSGLGVFRQARDRFMVPGSPLSASTFVDVSALASPDFLIEVEAVAWVPERLSGNGAAPPAAGSSQS